ncbi:hypothetical protein FDECE_4892 [Fusarium decemcellulare]|nr:hypothetical protein FDECE_4892 [Fusarium decemcellulare]
MTCHQGTTIGSSQPRGTVSGPLTRPHKYPNPGYLGQSSYTTLFGQLSPGHGDERTADDARQERGSGPTTSGAQLSRGTELIEQIYSLQHIPASLDLVKTWLATGANLALAAPFTKQCAFTSEQLFLGGHYRTATDLSRSLFASSCRPLVVDATTSLEEYYGQFSDDNARWETLAIFFVSVARAIFGCRSWIAPPFHNAQERRTLQESFMHLADRCIDMCLSLDCLNDLHLILQYESFILHSLVDGDQSFKSWRKLGDLISSLLALGYHEEIDSSSSLPGFLRSLRHTAFAYTYCADKNMSIFLGRPPRIHPKFCRFHVPGAETNSHPEGTGCSHRWDLETPLDFQFDGCWSAICAVLKEEILFLSAEDTSEDRADKARFGSSYLVTRLTLNCPRRIMASAQLQWLSLPPHFRLEGRLKACDRSPLELGLLLDAKLNYIHVLFLLRLALMRNSFEPDTELLRISSEMLGLVIEAVMFKDKIADGSTSLLWKATSATQTITSVLQCLVPTRIEHLAAAAPSGTVPQTPAAVANIDDGWSPWRHSGFQDFELNFWHTLAEHPFLVGDEVEISYMQPS